MRTTNYEVNMEGNKLDLHFDDKVDMGQLKHNGMLGFGKFYLEDTNDD